MFRLWYFCESLHFFPRDCLEHYPIDVMSGRTRSDLPLIRSLKTTKKQKFKFKKLFFFLWFERFDHFCQIYNYEDYFGFPSMTCGRRFSYRSHIWIEYFCFPFFSHSIYLTIIVYWIYLFSSDSPENQISGTSKSLVVESDKEKPNELI